MWLWCVDTYSFFNSSNLKQELFASGPRNNRQFEQLTVMVFRELVHSFGTKTIIMSHLVHSKSDLFYSGSFLVNIFQKVLRAKYYLKSDFCLSYNHKTLFQASLNILCSDSTIASMSCVEPSLLMQSTNCTYSRHRVLISKK